MGCDIHMYSERWNTKTKTWTLNEPCYDVWEEGCLCVPFRYAFYRERNYDVFAKLAGVRGNGPLSCLPSLRGAPDDMSAPVAAMYREWGDGAHSASWLRPGDLELAFHELGDAVEVHEGWAHPKHVSLLNDQLKNPHMYDIARSRISSVEREGWEPVWVHVPYEVTPFYRLLTSWHDKLKSLKRPARIVFWFDN